jgi:hypothetical protein
VVKSELISLAGALQGPAEAVEAPQSEWWHSYTSQLSSMSPTARAVLDSDTKYIAERGIFGAGGADGDFTRWPSTRLRKGLVMGAVQSGKTASLLGVVARALDSKVDVVVVLGGTRTALWKQTYRRLLEQLDTWTPETENTRRRKRVLLPAPGLIDDDPGLDVLYSETPNIVKRSLACGRPLIGVVMKHPDHLERFSRFLRPIVEQVCEQRDRPLHLLVLDDEADDGSILDSDLEIGEPVESQLRKQIPRRIARLWSERDPGVETYSQKLFCSYVAYTATPQSNILQSDHNPLSPTDFVCALRVPGIRGEVENREPTYLEVKGLAAQYTGGEIFYTKTEGAIPFCELVTRVERIDDETDEEFLVREESRAIDYLGNALRAYLVAGAIRIYQSGRRLSQVNSLAHASVEELRKILPAPHSMLIHPGAQVESHFEMARLIAEWASHGSTDEASLAGIEPTNLSKSGLVSRLNAEEPQWKDWLGRFRKTKADLLDKDGSHQLPAPDDSEWPQIKDLLESEIFPFVRVSVINSDPRADDSPIFFPQYGQDGAVRPPRNIFSIFVSGNVMARGITLEGLTTTLFLRSSRNPISDTQMQMQRWFGYRGSHLNLCRVFLYEDQYRLFRDYHEADEALRREILGYMNEVSTEAPKPTVLQGADFRATGKIANLRALPLSPGADSFLRVAEGGACAFENESILSKLLAAESWCELSVGGTLRGIYVDRQFSLVEAAGLLEQFRYSDHKPTSDGVSHRRWRSLERQHQIDDPEAPLFRSPYQGISDDSVPPNSCPYSIAAYLRLWNSLLSRHARGICPTDRPDTPWSMIDLLSYKSTAPAFTIGIRYGSAGTARNMALAARGVQRMERAIVDGKFLSTWGSRNPGLGPDSYFGDQMFDYHVTNKLPPNRNVGEPLWRPRGDGGLILFHVIKSSSDDSDIVTAGISIPLGGPDHIAALRGIG